MMVTRKSLSRRTVLRGVGATIALPFLDGMVPAYAALRPTAAKPLRRLAAVYVPMGTEMARWTPARTGAAGPSTDRFVAKEWGQETQLGSLELGLETAVLAGKCERGYSCVYSPTPLPVEHSPRAVVDRLFGGLDSTDSGARLAYVDRNRSILDAVISKIDRLQKETGPTDRAKIAEYLDAVRDVERRLQRAKEQGDQELPAVEQPVGVPSSFEEHAKLMFDLLVLAFQSDLTRVSTFTMAREMSVRTCPEIGIAEPHLPLSHHKNNPEKLAKQAALGVYHLQMFAYFLEKLRSTPDGDGSLLDQTLVLYGSGMTNSSSHIAQATAISLG